MMFSCIRTRRRYRFIRNVGPLTPGIAWRPLTAAGAVAVMSLTAKRGMASGKENYSAAALDE
jgi:hypothetical protein